MSVDELAYDALCTLCEGETIPDELRPQARTILGDMLIARPEPCAEATLAAVDNVLAAEARAAPGLALTPTGLPDAQWLTFGSTLLAVWRGDACKLAAGAVVNAANEAGLGCFQPSHKCIDNVIHRAAGPRLREKMSTAHEPARTARCRFDAIGDCRLSFAIVPRSARDGSNDPAAWTEPDSG